MCIWQDATLVVAYRTIQSNTAAAPDTVTNKNTEPAYHCLQLICMSTYRLLRDNKESGPYSFEELSAKGFKAYDLVWVEGKSAGWRYPGEITEFRLMAPVVEEQPFDRFYKKPSATEEPPPSILEQKRLARLQQETEARQQYLKPQPAKPAAVAIPVTAVTAPAAISPKIVGPHIHVTMPVLQTAATTTATVSPKEQTKAVSNTTSFQPKQPSTVTATAVAQKITHPVEAQPVYSKTATAGYKKNEFNWTTYIGLGIGVLTLVGLGIMIGMSIIKQENELVKKQYIEQQLKPTIKKQPPTTAPVGTATMPVATVTEQANLNSGHAGNKAAEGVPAKKEPVIKTAPAVIITSNSASTEKSIANNTAVNTTEEKRVLTPAINLEKQVTVASNNYKVGAFGGITGLACTVNNQSKYSMDAVQVEVQFLLANDKVFKSSIIQFKDIAPGNQQTIALPKISRGVKVFTRVLNIHSKEINAAGTTVKL